MIQETASMDRIAIRPANPLDRPQLREAVVELQEHERRLHATLLPGEQIADAYLEWMLMKAAATGTVLVAEIDGAFAGFVAGWVEDEEKIAETPDSRRFGLVSDICVLPAYRGQRLASRLLAAIERHLASKGITRVRLDVLAANAPARASYERSGYTTYEITYEKIVASEGA
jgi:ribosomal protein S18 acetylase RimI-like enzyme